MDRIYWTEEEKRKLVDLVISMRISDPVPSITAIVNHAQEQLPQERRRTIIAASAVGWLVEEAKDRIASLKKLEETVEQLRQQLSAARQEIEVLKQSPASVLSPRELMGLAFDRLENRIVAAEARSRVQAPSPASSNGTKKKDATTHRIPKVLVVGLKGQQAQGIKDALSEVPVTLLFGDERDQGLGPQADAVVMTKFCRHAVWDRIREQHTIVIRAPGGVLIWQRAIRAAIEYLKRPVQTKVHIARFQ